jgi:hypothetical protein
MGGNPPPQFFGCCIDVQLYQAWMIEQTLDSRAQLTELQFIARIERRRKRPIFRARVMIASSEHNRDESMRIACVERRFARQSHFDPAPGWNMRAGQTRRQRRRVVCNYDVAGSQQVDEIRAREVTHVAALVDV